MEKIYMKFPPTGEVKHVDAAFESIHPLMLEGWQQCPAPQQPETATQQAEIDHHEGE